MTNSLTYRLSLRVLSALGGDTSKTYDSIDDIWGDINKIYNVETDNEDPPTTPPVVNPPSTGNNIDWTVIGYSTEENDKLIYDIKKHIDYSKTVFDTWDVNNQFCGTMFHQNHDIVYVPAFDFTNVIDSQSMFSGCINLKYFPKIETPNLEIINSMFMQCSALEVLPAFDFSKVRLCEFLFADCMNLKQIGGLNNLSPEGSINCMFVNNNNLQEIPYFDTSKVTSMESTFTGCFKITSIPAFDTSNVTRLNNTFSENYMLQSIPLLDCGNMNYISNAFNNLWELVDVGGFKDVGKQENGTYELNFSASEKLTHDSVMNIINNLHPITNSSAILVFHNSLNASISDDEKAIAAGKGWSLNFY